MGLEVSTGVLERLTCDPSPEGVKAFIGPAGYLREFEREVVSVPGWRSPAKGARRSSRVERGAVSRAERERDELLHRGRGRRADDGNG